MKLFYSSYIIKKKVIYSTVKIKIKPPAAKHWFATRLSENLILKTACGTHDKCRGKHRTVVLVLDTNQSSLISMISCKAYVNNGSVTCSFPKISTYCV